LSAGGEIVGLAPAEIATDRGLEVMTEGGAAAVVDAEIGEAEVEPCLCLG